MALLAFSLACGRAEGDREIKEQAQRAAEVESLDKQAKEAAKGMDSKLRNAGVTGVVPDAETLQLTAPQKAALEARLKQEKNSTYQALLQEVLDKDAEIRTLNQKIASLRSSLPAPEIAGKDDSHFGMAMAYLRRRGVPEDKARVLVSKVLLLDKVTPGFAVYHFYSHGVYGTWVAQGRADISPTQLQAEQKATLEGERDTASLRARELQASLAELTAEKDRVSADIEALRTERTSMTADLKALTAASETQQALLNSVHFRVGARKALEKAGVIVVPIFAKDRAGSNWSDAVFDRSADLRNADEVEFTAAEAGLEHIGKVDVVPGSLERNKHYTLALNDDRTVAKVRFLNKERFRNEKVVFALGE
jgi:hypothetical protein